MPPPDCAPSLHDFFNHASSHHAYTKLTVRKHHSASLRTHRHDHFNPLHPSFTPDNFTLFVASSNHAKSARIRESTTQ
jgi:hypothetical protein